jgi:hypothetical protein
MDFYVSEWQLLKEKWSEKTATVAYMETLQGKQHKWAFAFTHNFFVAGVSSTQRQESVSFQFKADLIANSRLTQLVTCFQQMDERTSRKIALATLNPTDPIIDKATQLLTGYESDILKEECSMSLSYFCELLSLFICLINRSSISEYSPELMLDDD